MTTTKTCTKCGEKKSLGEYSKNKNTRDGRESHCKPCKAEQQRRYREANREKLAEQKRRWREENREQIAEYNRRYSKENREKIGEQQRRYREANPEKVAERHRRYREENREQVAEYQRGYLAKHRDYVLQRTRENNREHQRLSLYTAHRREHPWTADDDDMVLNSPMTLFQIAVTLNKTYNQVAQRRATLRKKLTTTEAT